MSRRDPASARLALIGDAAMIGGFVLLSAWLLWLQRDGLQWSDPGMNRWLGAALVVAAWLGLLGVLRLRRSSSLKPVAAGEPAASPVDGHVLQVIHASQTGVAEQLAKQTAETLQAAGMPVRLRGFEDLRLDELRGAGQVLFVASTTGEGDPPDVAERFVRAAMKQPADLHGLRYGLLALGDSDYEDFCGFGRTLQQWLQASGAQALFDPVEVDREDGAALRHWQHHLAMLSGASELPDWQPPAYQRWRLAERRLLNAGSVGEACFHLELQPPADGADWQAGDLVEIGPCHAAARVEAWLALHGLDGQVEVSHDNERLPLAELLARSHLPDTGDVDGLDETTLAATLQRLPHREYSIASLPADGAIHLLVRRMRGLGGYLGLGSGWLTEHAPIGSTIALRVRSNPNFHVPPDARPLILIGNGTGLAALRALLKARIAAGHRRNWLLFGERHAAHDFHYRDEIRQWQADGWIESLQFAWSRDQSERIHVQHRLRESAEQLRQWVEAGAAIHVCGSLDGMAPGVDTALRDVLGDAQVERLRGEGRYRRDVY